MTEEQFKQFKEIMTNLKPCPFCGSTSLKIMYKETDFYGWNGLGAKKHKYKVYIRCNKCFSRGTPISFDWIEGRADSTEKFHEHDKEALEAWNRRADNDNRV